jgi:hypothetical protein
MREKKEKIILLLVDSYINSQLQKTQSIQKTFHYIIRFLELFPLLIFIKNILDFIEKRRCYSQNIKHREILDFPKCLQHSLFANISA